MMVIPTNQPLIMRSQSKLKIPVFKSDLVKVEQEWVEIAKLISLWGITISNKNAYTKSEVIDFVRQV